MKKIIIRCLEFVIGLFAGLISLAVFSADEEIVDTVKEILHFSNIPYVITNKDNLVKIAVFILCSVISVLILTYIIRLFTDSKNLEIFASILNVFVILIVGIPVTSVLCIGLEQKVFVEIKKYVALDVLLKILILCVTYAVVFCIICNLLEISYYEKLKKERKRCKLMVCQVKNEKEYEVHSVVVEKKTFPVCYDYMKNNKDLVEKRQFFKIVEMNWNNKKELNSWRYYRTADLIEVDDDELCAEMVKNDFIQNITWQG